MPSIERFRGCLLGLAAGDAVGATLEFLPPGAFAPIADMVGGGPFGLQAGQWTDDTSMALCLAESLITCRGMNLSDQLRRYVRWYREGYLSSRGHCFDIGNTTRTALLRFERTGNPHSGSGDPAAAGNGSLMRLAPIPMFFAADPVQAVERSGESSLTTHGALTAVDACRYLGGLIAGALRQASKEQLLTARFSPHPGYWREHPLVAEIDEVAAGSFKRREPPEIAGVGYVVKSLEAALWAFHRSSSFREGVLLAANLGHDADSTAAVYGQLAGAFYGVEGIPMEWRAKLTMGDLIINDADKLFELSNHPDEQRSPTVRTES